jgi:hypothetical protein
MHIYLHVYVASNLVCRISTLHSERCILQGQNDKFVALQCSILLSDNYVDGRKERSRRLEFLAFYSEEFHKTWLPTYHEGTKRSKRKCTRLVTSVAFGKISGATLVWQIENCHSSNTQTQKALQVRSAVTGTVNTEHIQMILCAMLHSLTLS